MGPAVLTRNQQSARGRNDNGNETSATWKAAANAVYSMNVDANFRHRILLQLTTSAPKANVTETWQYSYLGGAWTNITTTSSVVKAVLSPNYIGPVHTTQQLGAGTFVTPNSGLIENSGGPGSATEPDMAGNDECEFEGCFQIVGTAVSDGDTIRLRIQDDATDLENYNAASLFNITVLKPLRTRRVTIS